MWLKDNVSHDWSQLRANQIVDIKAQLLCHFTKGSFRVNLICSGLKESIQYNCKAFGCGFYFYKL